MVERDGDDGDDAARPDPHAPTERARRPGSAPKLPSSRRVTMNFTGPPLALPADARSEGEPLDLDTSELSTSVHEASPVARPAPRLELDLEGLERPVEPRAHDGWVIDKQRRSTPPPRPWAPDVLPPPVRPSSLPARIPAQGTGDALGLVDRSRPSAVELDLVTEMTDRFALGDFSGALRAAELVLGAEPAHPQARRYADECRVRVEALHIGRLGALDRVPRLSVAEADIRWLGLDHRAAFLLSRIDGRHTFEELLDLSAMPRLEALKTLVELYDAGVIRTEPAP